MALDPTGRSDPQLPHPALKAILLCDRLIQEAETGKITLVGVVDRLTASETAGEYPIRMEVVRVADEQTIARGEAVAPIPDRTSPYDIRFDFPRVPFERPGQYEFRLFADGRFVGGAVLWVETPDTEAA